MIDNRKDSKAHELWRVYGKTFVSNTTVVLIHENKSWATFFGVQTLCCSVVKLCRIITESESISFITLDKPYSTV